MVHAMMFDTLQYTKELEAAGVKTKEAEAHARALTVIFERHEDHVATKGDVDRLKNEMIFKFAETDNKIATLRNDMDLKFAQMEIKFSDMKVEIIKWVIGISAAQVALVISALKFIR